MSLCRRTRVLRIAPPGKRGVLPYLDRCEESGPRRSIEGKVIGLLAERHKPGIGMCALMIWD